MTESENNPAEIPQQSTNKRALAIVFVTVFIDLLGFGIVLPLLPLYAKSFGMSKMTLGLLMASFSAMQFVFAPLWGRLSDRIGRRPVLILGLAGSTVFYALFGLASSLGTTGKLLGLGVFAWLFITRIGAGVAGATISTAQAFIADVTGRHDRAKGMALIGAAFGIGFVFGPIIGALCLRGEDQTPALPGYIAAGLSFVAFLWALMSLPESLTSRDDVDETASHAGIGNLGRLVHALGRPIIGVTLGTIFLTIFAFAMFESTLALLNEYLKLERWQNGLMFAYVGVVLTIVQGGIVRRIAPKFGEFRMANTGVAMLVLGLILLALTSQISGIFHVQPPVVLLVILPLVVTGFAFANPAYQSLLSLNSPKDEQGGTLGLGQSVSATGRILGPFIGVSLQKFGIATPYWVAAAIMVLAWLMTWTLPSRSSAHDSLDLDEQPVPLDAG
ncbi:MAG: MFS transporter [Planctomycetaceae bacterium]|nr:MFS transporter [Planctomycetaceae bacterium]MCB9951286.1 MFS transporter [Planctomycetaceae bacterium]